MTTIPPTPSAPAAPTQTTTATTTGGQSLDKDAFLKLLVAQLQYQDPMKPTDSSEWMAQTAQFTMVEQITALNKQAASDAVVQRLTTASTLVGKTVGYIDDDGKDHTGVVTSVRFTTDGAYARVGSVDVPLSIIDIVSPTASATATAAADTAATTAADKAADKATDTTSETATTS